MTQTETPEGLISLTVNGRPRELKPGTTISDLLADLGIQPRMVVVEHNRTIVRDRSLFERTVLAQGDSLELVHFVGGG
jgi:thiamine biosynthesis protein ThiS